jgi:hypothetical protein
MRLMTVGKLIDQLVEYDRDTTIMIRMNEHDYDHRIMLVRDQAVFEAHHGVFTEPYSDEEDIIDILVIE